MGSSPYAYRFRIHGGAVGAYKEESWGVPNLIGPPALLEELEMRPIAT